MVIVYNYLVRVYNTRIVKNKFKYIFNQKHIPQLYLKKTNEVVSGIIIFINLLYFLDLDVGQKKILRKNKLLCDQPYNLSPLMEPVASSTLTTCDGITEKTTFLVSWYYDIYSFTMPGKQHLLLEHMRNCVCL